MSLLDLPDELLSLIIEHTLPDGYEGLMLSCHKLHDAGRGFIEKHNHYRRKYTHICYPRNDYKRYRDGHLKVPITDEFEIVDSLHLLRDIMNDCRIAAYVKTIDFSRDCYSQGLSIFMPGDHESVTRHTIAKLNLPSQLAQSMYQHYDSPKAEGKCGPAFMYLITLGSLPNVKHVTGMHAHCWACRSSYRDPRESHSHPKWHLLETLVNRAASINAHPAALSSLASITMGSSRNHVVGRDAWYCVPILRLPSLRLLALDRCTASMSSACNQPDEQTADEPCSNVEKLELWHNACTREQLAKMLQCMPRLRSIKISFYATRTTPDFDASQIVDAIRRTYADTLTQLSLGIAFISRSSQVKGGVHDFKGFPRLQHLELDMRVFFGPCMNDVTQCMSPSAFRDYTYEVAHWNGSKLPCLADILPASIVTVSLLAGSSREDILMLKALFRGLGQRAKSDLPRLLKLSVSRATSSIGFNRLPNCDDREAAWMSVANCVRAEGFLYKESPNVTIDFRFDEPTYHHECVVANDRNV